MSDELSIEQMTEMADVVLELQDSKLNVRRTWVVKMAEHSVGEKINFLQYRGFRRKANAMLVLDTAGNVVEWLLSDAPSGTPVSTTEAPVIPAPSRSSESSDASHGVAGISASVLASATGSQAPIDRRSMADIIVVKNPTGLGFNIVKNKKGPVGTWVKNYDQLGAGVLVLDVDGVKEIAWIEKVAVLPSVPVPLNTPEEP